MAPYIEGRMYSLKAGEKISVRTTSQIFVRTMSDSTARVLLDENRPETLTIIPAGTSATLTIPPGCRSALVEAVGGWVVINDPSGTRVPDTSVHYW